MGTIFRLGNSPRKQNEDELRTLAEELGLKFTRSGKHEGPKFSGRIGPTKVRVRTSNLGTCRIKAKFESGLPQMSGFSVQPRATDIRTNKREIITGDHHFDSSFLTLADPEFSKATEILGYLTALRREVIHTLGDTFERIRIEDDEIEVHMIQDPPVDPLREAIDLCVLAASAFDVGQQS